MTFNWKRIGLVVGFVLITIGIGITIYFVFFKGLFGVGLNRNENINGAEFPNINANRNVNAPLINVNVQVPNINVSLEPGPIAKGGKTTVSPVAPTIPGGATLAPNGKDLIYYDPVTGKFYQISPDGRTKTLLSPDTYPAADKITWSPLKDKVILEFPDGSKIIYDIRQKRQYTLAPEMEDIGFSPTGDKITFKFIGSDESDQLLVMSNFDGSGAETLEPLADKANQFDVNWSPSGNIVALFQESINATQQRVIPIGTKNENFKSFDVPGRGFESTWSPDGQQILFSVFRKDTGYNPELYIADGTSDSMGNNTTDLGLATWPDKCVFGAGSTLYCAVPQYLDQGSGLYTDLAKDVPDDFYRIDLSTGQKQLIARPVDSEGTSDYNAVQLRLANDGSALYFYDQRSRTYQKILLR
ncbi:MAG: hypothetical protein V1907_01865 [Candidatus Kerfeldbacteria bacterium]